MIDLDGIVIAQTPQRDQIGQQIVLDESVPSNWLTNLLNDDISESFSDPLKRRHALPDGNWLFTFPIGVGGEQTVGAMVLTVEPAPSGIQSYLFQFGTLIALAAGVLLIGVAPFGALFGFLMARNLTKRLARLEKAAAAWSQGDFDVMPEESSRDEIGQLSNRLNQMAQEISQLLHHRQALTLLEERNRLASDLHDTVKQQNFATLMQIRAAKNRVTQISDSEAALRYLDSAETLLKQSQQDLEGVIGELRPTQLEGIGLTVALRQFSDEWSARTHITTQINVSGEHPISLAAQEALYRLTQEAFSNIARHSNASHVVVELNYTPQCVKLTIEDDGQGFDPERVANGFGLSTMRQRMTAVGGNLIITSDKGVVILAEIPF